MQERITKRLAELEQERDRYLAEANRQLAGFEGAIAALRALLVDDPPAGGDAISAGPAER